MHLQTLVALSLALGACRDPALEPVSLPSDAVVLADAGQGPLERITYMPEAFVGLWRTGVRFTSRPNAESPVDVDAELVMRFAIVGPSTLDSYLHALSLSGSVAGEPLGPYHIAGSDPKYASAVATPLSNLTFGPAGPTGGVPNPKNPIAKQGNNLIHSAIFSIPPIPTQPVGVGARWRSKRIVPRSSDAGPEVVMDILYTLTEIAPCESDTSARCAVIMSTGDTGKRDEEHTSGVAMKVHYTLSGEATIELGGALVSAETRMKMDLESEAITLALDGVITTRRP